MAYCLPADDDREPDVQYALGFYFNPEGTKVVLIEKLKPKWQKGKLNGVGGKLEGNEIPTSMRPFTETYLACMVREFKEETGIETKPEDWENFATYHGEGWYMYIFKAFGDVSKAKTMEAEEVRVVDVNNLPENVINNLRFLIPMALQEDICPVHINQEDWNDYLPGIVNKEERLQVRDIIKAERKIRKEEQRKRRYGQS